MVVSDEQQVNLVQERTEDGDLVGGREQARQKLPGKLRVNLGVGVVGLEQPQQQRHVDLLVQLGLLLPAEVRYHLLHEVHQHAAPFHAELLP